MTQELKSVLIALLSEPWSSVARRVAKPRRADSARLLTDLGYLRETPDGSIELTPRGLSKALELKAVQFGPPPPRTDEPT